MNQIIPLDNIKPNQNGRVTSINVKTVQVIHQLMGDGLLPDAQVSVVQNDSLHVLFFADFNELAVSEEIASEIFVEMES